LTGIDLGETGAVGECVGLRKELSVIGSGGTDAPGLKLKEGKAGRAGDRGLGLSVSTSSPRPDICGSIAERGRLPEARVPEAEEDEGRAGNTNGGLGGGTFDLGESCGLPKGDDREAIMSTDAEVVMRRVPGLLKLSFKGEPRNISDSVAVAIILSRTAAPEVMDN